MLTLVLCHMMQICYKTEQTFLMIVFNILISLATLATFYLLWDVCCVPCCKVVRESFFMWKVKMMQFSMGLMLWRIMLIVIALGGNNTERLWCEFQDWFSVNCSDLLCLVITTHEGFSYECLDVGHIVWWCHYLSEDMNVWCHADATWCKSGRFVLFEYVILSKWLQTRASVALTMIDTWTIPLVILILYEIGRPWLAVTYDWSCWDVRYARGFVVM